MATGATPRQKIESRPCAPCGLRQVRTGCFFVEHRPGKLFNIIGSPLRNRVQYLFLDISLLLLHIAAHWLLELLRIRIDAYQFGLMVRPSGLKIC